MTVQTGKRISQRTNQEHKQRVRHRINDQESNKTQLAQLFGRTS